MTTARLKLRDLLDSADFARAYALAAFGIVFSGYLIEHTAGLATLATMITGLCVVGVAILVVRRAELSLLRLVPTSIVLFIAWAGVTLLFPSGNAQSPASWVALVGFAIVAVVVAHVRDTLQTVRALGDVLRTLLTLSAFVELLSGVLLDMPFPFIQVQGNIALGGPVQGIFGTRNLLGLVAVIALVTFVIEMRTYSISRGLGIYSLVLGGGLAALSASPTVIVLCLAVAVSSGVLAIVRHTSAQARDRVQWVLGSIIVVGLGAAWALRGTIVSMIGAAQDVADRGDLWASILLYVRARAWQGWGWRGPWNPEDPTAFPYNAINSAGTHHASALNAYLDVLLQLGVVGLVLFLTACTVALVRSWLVASDRRSVLYAWTPLILVTLLVDSLFESFTLVSIGWMMLVLCSVRAGQSRSWRENIDAARSPETPGLAG